MFISSINWKCFPLLATKPFLCELYYYFGYLVLLYLSDIPSSTGQPIDHHIQILFSYIIIFVKICKNNLWLNKFSLKWRKLPNIRKAQAALTVSGHFSDITEHKSKISSKDILPSFSEENTVKMRSLKGLYCKTVFLQYYLSSKNQKGSYLQLSEDFLNVLWRKSSIHSLENSRSVNLAKHFVYAAKLKKYLLHIVLLL